MALLENLDRKGLDVIKREVNQKIKEADEAENAI